MEGSSKDPAEGGTTSPELLNIFLSSWVEADEEARSRQVSGIGTAVRALMA